MLKCDWQTAVIMGMIMSIAVDYWRNYVAPKRFKSWLERTSDWWYAFFFCWYCLLGKLCLLSGFFIQPFMFIEVAPYPIWRVLQFIGNFFLVGFVAIICHAILSGAIKIISIQEVEDKKVQDTESDIMKRKVVKQILDISAESLKAMNKKNKEETVKILAEKK